jgi:hypothetical protein
VEFVIPFLYFRPKEAKKHIISSNKIRPLKLSLKVISENAIVKFQTIDRCRVPASSKYTARRIFGGGAVALI